MNIQSIVVKVVTVVLAVIGALAIISIIGMVLMHMKMMPSVGFPNNMASMCSGML